MQWWTGSGWTGTLPGSTGLEIVSLRATSLTQDGPAISELPTSFPRLEIFVVDPVTPDYHPWGVMPIEGHRGYIPREFEEGELIIPTGLNIALGSYTAPPGVYWLTAQAMSD